MENLLLGIYVGVPVVGLVANYFGKWWIRSKDASDLIPVLLLWPVGLLLAAAIYLPGYLLPEGDD